MKVTKQKQKSQYVFILTLALLVGFFGIQKYVKAAAGINQQISFQGKIAVKADGTNVADGNYNFNFKIYSQQYPGGSVIWQELNKSLTVTSGIFQTYLGDATALPGSIDFNSDNIYLGIEFNGDGEMNPRIQFAATPYSFNSLKLNGADWASPLAIGTGTAAAGTFTNLATNTGGVSIADGQAYGGAGAVTLSSTTNGLTLDSGSNTLTIATSDTALTASGLATLTVGANATITNASGNLTLQPAGSGTIASVLIGAGGAGSANPDFLGLDVKNSTGDPAGGYEGAMYYNTTDNKFRCYQDTAWIDCIGTGGSGYATVMDEAGVLTQRSTINFTGAGVTCADDSGNGRTNCTINGGTGGGVNLAPSSADSDSSANASIFVNDTGGGNLIKMQQNGVDKFAVSNSGAIGVGTSAPTDPANLLQIGSATNRGDVAMYGDLIEKGIVNQKNISGTISDVFVYDTTRDSDGGRWTESRASQNLSWALETKDNSGSACNLSTDDRCGESTFPRKATFVATGDAVYIMDTDNGTMWMKFTQVGTYALGSDSANNPSSVYGLNGVMYVGTNGGSSTGMYAIDFINDKIYRFNTTDRNRGDKNIANRNTAVSYTAESILPMKFIGTESVKVNDVSAVFINGGSSVLTNSGPQNGATFVCAATDDGVQVINMSSGITIPFGSSVTDQFSACALTKRARMYVLNVTKQQLERYGNPATSANNIDTTAVAQATGVTTAYKTWDESTTAANAPNLFNTAKTINTSPDTLEVIERGSLAERLATGAGDLIYVGHGGGLTEIHDVDTNATPTLGWSKYYTSTFETNLMSGTPRGMFPMNETSGDLTDVTVRNNKLTPKGSPSPTFGVNGVHGTGISLNGSANYFCSGTGGTCATDADYDPGTLSFSVEAWFKHSTSMSGIDTLIDHSYTTAPAQAAGYRIYMSSSGQILATIDDDATFGDEDLVTTTLSFNDNQWHHIVFNRVTTALTTPAVAVGIYLYIDGRLVGSDTSIGATGTLNSSSILAVGADCSVGAACSTGANFWDGQIDDVYFSMGGATTADSLNQTQIRRKYLEGLGAMRKKTLNATVADIASTTTIGKTGSTWGINDYAGSIVEITSGTGAGQTRRVIANDATTLTVSPAWTTPTGATFEIQPEQLYGGTDNVTSIGITDNTFLGEERRLYVGTNSSSDTGGVTLFQGFDNSYATDVYHIDSGKTDDFSSAWNSVSNSDNMVSFGTNGISVAFGSTNSLWTETDNINFEAQIDKFANNINIIRNEMVSKGLTGSAFEFGSMGADLAEYYLSLASLEAGDIVQMSGKSSEEVSKSDQPYQKTVIGVVASNPGITLGAADENSYPVALKGRVPVKVTSENGIIQKGDEIVSSSLAGYGMRAIEAGRTVGIALESMDDVILEECPVEAGLATETKCGKITVFVNVIDFSGIGASQLMKEKNYEVNPNDQFASLFGELEVENFSTEEENSQNMAVKNEVGNILQAANTLGFLQSLNDPNYVGFTPESEIFAKSIQATKEIISPLVVADTIVAKNIKAENIEGLNFIQASVKNSQETVMENSANINNLGQKIDLLGLQVAELTAKAEFAQTQALNPESLKNSQIAGELEVVEKAQFKGAVAFDSFAQFLSQVVFKKQAIFEEKVSFEKGIEIAGVVVQNNDSAGFAVIKKGEDKIKISFSEAYAQIPVVSAVFSLQPIEEKELRDLAEEFLLQNNIKFIVTKVDNKGFEIKLDKKAPISLPFAWQASSVKNVKVFGHDERIEEVENLSDNQSENTQPLDAQVATKENSGKEEVSLENIVQEVPIIP